MKQAYRKEFDSWGWAWYPVELTGLCKKVTGGPYGDIEYYQAQTRVFGIPLWKRWISKDELKFFDPVEETIYECDCGKES